MKQTTYLATVPNKVGKIDARSTAAIEDDSKAKQYVFDHYSGERGAPVDFL
jgi:hypothetical protein